MREMSGFIGILIQVQQVFFDSHNLIAEVFISFFIDDHVAHLAFHTQVLPPFDRFILKKRLQASPPGIRSAIDPGILANRGQEIQSIGYQMYTVNSARGDMPFLHGQKGNIGRLFVQETLMFQAVCSIHIPMIA